MGNECPGMNSLSPSVALEKFLFSFYQTRLSLLVDLSVVAIFVNQKVNTTKIRKRLEPSRSITFRSNRTLFIFSIQNFNEIKYRLTSYF